MGAFIFDLASSALMLLLRAMQCYRYIISFQFPLLSVFFICSITSYTFNTLLSRCSVRSTLHRDHLYLHVTSHNNSKYVLLWKQVNNAFLWRDVSRRATAPVPRGLGCRVSSVCRCGTNVMPRLCVFCVRACCPDVDLCRHSCVGAFVCVYVCVQPSKSRMRVRAGLAHRCPAERPATPPGPVLAPLTCGLYPTSPTSLTSLTLLYQPYLTLKALPYSTSPTLLYQPYLTLPALYQPYFTLPALPYSASPTFLCQPYLSLPATFLY